MADGIVSFGVQKLWELLIREAERLTGIHEQATELQSDLRRLRCFLKDAEAKKYESQRVRNCLEEIKEIIYDAEDIIETFLLKEGSIDQRRIRKRFKRFACVVMNRMKVNSQIKCITVRISKVVESMQSLGIQNIIDNGNPLESSPERLREIRQSFPNVSESVVVGLDSSIEELTEHLVEKGTSEVYSICGMGGIGKTTLARQVFKHDSVRHHFDEFAWVFVSQQCRRKHVWQGILSSLTPKDEEHRIHQMSEEQLQDELFTELKSRRCLIVLDDVWKATDWDLLKPAFPQSTGSKIIITCRNEYVASHADPRGIVFRPRCLTHEEGWKLLQQIAVSGRDDIDFRIDEVMEEVEKMIKHCGGLPLALKTLGGLLATKRTTAEWIKVHDNIRSHIIRETSFGDSDNPVFHVMSLSYEDLPFRLKHCFLYLAHFPEDHEISTETLFSYWIAEGIEERSLEEKSSRDIAESYLEELVKRNMVLVTERNAATLRIDSFRLHDVMRDVCLSKAKEENFVEIVGIETHVSNINSSRRLAIHLVNDDDKEPIRFNQRRIRNPKARSLLYMTRDFNPWILFDPSFKGLRSLRVLDLFGAQFRRGKLPKNIGKLIHLRYLSLRETNVSRLPSSLGNLTLMISLDIEIYDRTVHVPNVLKKMKDLINLMLPGDLSEKTKLELGNLVKLETLKNFSMKHSNVEDLLKMIHLRSLWINISGTNNTKILSLSTKLKHLEEFMLYHDKTNDGTKLDKLDMGQILSGFRRLNQLTLDIKVEKLPDELQFPSRIVSISLSSCRLIDDPIPVLEKLHNLKVMSLELNAFIGKKMVCSKDGFCQLNSMELSVMDKVEEWIVEKGSMPRLCNLEINDCGRLKMLPNGLKYISSLKELRVRWMQKAFKEKLIRGGEDYYKVQHIPFVVFYCCDEEQQHSLTPSPPHVQI